MLNISMDRPTRIRVVNMEVYDNYSLIKGKSARKDRNTGEYHNSVWNFVRFVTEAHKKIDQLQYEFDLTDKFDGGDSIKGVWIELDRWSLSNESYVKDGETKYSKNYTITVWNWDFPDKENSQPSGLDTPPIVNNDDDNDDLPF